MRPKTLHGWCSVGNYYLYQIAAFITRFLPLKASYALGVFLSDCQYLLSKADRQAVRDNLSIILKTQQVPSAKVREVFHNFGKYLVDFFTMTQRVDQEFIKKYVQISGAEYFNEARSHGKGGILISAHLGNWEMPAGVIKYLGYPLSVIALSHRDQRVNAFFNKQREFFGIKVIQTNVAVRRCVEHLKENRLVAILADRDFGNHGIPMDFLGRKALIPKGAALFSIKTGAPVIPTFFLRTPQDGFKFIIGKPIYPFVVSKEHKITDKDLESFIEQYLKKIDEQIQQNPTQWLIFRRFNIV